MGPGFMMTSAVFDSFKTLNFDEFKQTVEALGIDFLIDTFGNRDLEDFATPSKEAAELVKVAVVRQFKQDFGEDYPFSVDVVQHQGKWKIAFFK